MGFRAGSTSLDVLGRAVAELASALVAGAADRPWDGEGVEEVVVRRVQPGPGDSVELDGHAVQVDAGDDARAHPLRTRLRIVDGELEYVLRLGDRWRLRGASAATTEPLVARDRDPSWRLVFHRLPGRRVERLVDHDAACRRRARAWRRAGCVMTAAGIALAVVGDRIGLLPDGDAVPLAVLIGVGGLLVVLGPWAWTRLEGLVRRA